MNLECRNVEVSAILVFHSSKNNEARSLARSDRRSEWEIVRTARETIPPDADDGGNFFLSLSLSPSLAVDPKAARARARSPARVNEQQKKLDWNVTTTATATRRRDGSSRFPPERKR